MKNLEYIKEKAYKVGVKVKVSENTFNFFTNLYNGPVKVSEIESTEMPLNISKVKALEILLDFAYLACETEKAYF